ncbi:reverse transcriptase domain-containing protein [Tanacetum coccineum]
MVSATTPLLGFSGEISWPLGQISLMVTLGDEEHSTSTLMSFMVVRSPLPYNGIISRPGLRKIQAVPSTAHGMIKSRVEGGIVTIRSNTIIPAEYRMVAEAQSILPPKEPTATEGIKVAIHPEHPEQTITIGRNQSEKGRMELCNLLKENIDIFSWKPADMTGVSRHIAEHRLNVREGCQPVRQKRRGQAPDRNKAIQEEVAKLVEAEIMREVHYHDWLSNPVMGIKACPEKVEAVVKLHSPQTLKEAQSLYGKLTSLNRFLSKSAEKSLPFFKTLKRCVKKSDFQWTPEAQKAFQSMKECIAELPMVTVPKPREELILYLNAAREAISAVLLTKRDSRQMPIYFVSRALQAPEINYSPMEKVVLALVHATRRLRRPRTSIRGQVLADFIAKKIDKEEPPAGVQTEEAVLEPWILFTDGSSCLEGSGAGLILTNPEGKEFTYALRFEFDASNNEAEYEALVVGLRIAEQMGVKNLIAKVDSRLVPRSENKKADALSKIASTSFAHLTKQVLVETLKRKSIEEKEILTIVEEEGYCWMTPLIEYLTEGTLPAETKKACAIKIKERQYAMINGVLYKKSFREPWLRCVGPTQVEYVVREIHEGSCNMHSGPRSVVAKVIRSGYYWLTMHKDARNIIRTCNDCQTHRLVSKNPQQKLTPITSPWNFYKWGIDISGPFLEGQGKVKFLIVAIDYFTKWIEAKPVATITENQVKKFVWDNIVCRFGLPGEIISDNGKQFRDNTFDWCKKLNIKQRFASVEEVSHVLWAHRTMIKTSNEDTQFSLTYGTKAVIPVEIRMTSLRCTEVNQAKNDEGLLLNLDILEEKRERAAVREARSKARMEKYYNAKARNASFRLGDFVYRSNEASHAKDNGKLGLKWEGPYEVIEALVKGAYKLRNGSEDILPRT